MKIFSLGLDNSILDKNSALAVRVVSYGKMVEKYTVVVISDHKDKVILSEKVEVYGGGGKYKIVKLLNCYKIANWILLKQKFDVITVQDQYYLALIGWRLAKKFKIGLELQVHGFEKFYGIRKAVAKYVLPRANAVRVVSQRLKKQLISEFGVKENRITVVPIYSELGIRKQEAGIRKQEAGSRKPAQARSKKEGGKFIFLTVGRLVKVKNIRMQIGAMAEVVKKYPETELWIVGDGEERKNLEVITAKAGQGSKKLSAFGGSASGGEIKNFVKFFGWQNNLEKFYEQADVYLLTSNYEGWGLSIIEAASFGLPIIMTDVGCADEVIKNNESGIIILPNDKEELVKAMIKLIENIELRKKLGEAAQEAVKKLPNEQQTVELYRESLEKVLKIGLTRFASHHSRESPLSADRRGSRNINKK